MVDEAAEQVTASAAPPPAAPAASAGAELSTPSPGGRAASSSGTAEPPTGKPGWSSFRIIWLGQLFSVLGGPMQTVALSLWAQNSPGGHFALSWMATAGTLGILIGTLLGGSLSDRLPILRILLACDLVAATLVCGIAALVFLEAPVQAVLPLLFLAGICSGVFAPAVRSIAPTFLDSSELERANRLLAISANISVLAGGLLGAGFAALMGTGAVVLLNAATFAIGAFATATVMSRHPEATRGRPATATGSPHLLGRVMDGLRYAWQTPWIRTLVIVDAVCDLVTAGQFVVGLQLIGNKAAGGVGIAMLLGAYGVGALFGAMLAPRVARRRNITIRTVMALNLLQAPFLAFIPVLPFPAAVTSLIIAGVMNGALGVLYMSFLQRNVSAHMLGRVMSLLIFASLSLAPLALLAAGFLFSEDLIAVSFLVGAAILALASLLAMVAPSLNAAGLRGSRDIAPATS